MRFNTLRFLIREGFRGMVKNGFMSAASVLVLVCCLLITGCSYLLIENIDHGFESIYKENVVVAYSEEGTEKEKLATIKQEIEKLDNVAAVEFRSKEDMLKDYADDPSIGSLLDDLEADNPLPDTYVIHFKDLAKFDATVKKIESIEGLSQVDYDSALAKMLTNARSMVFTVGIWIVALLLIVSLFIIVNTIKLTVYSRRLEIYIMRSVGATRRFIRFPFVVEGITLGVIAGGVTYGVVYGVYMLVERYVDFGKNFQLVPFASVWWQLLAGFMGVGVFIGIIGSCISLSRYLKENME